MKKIYYIANILEQEVGHDRFAVSAADLQARYLSEMFIELGYDVDIISPNIPSKGGKLIQYQKGFTKNISEHLKIYYFGCFYSKNRLIQAFARRFIFFNTERFIRRHLDGTYIIYHSRIFYPYYRLLHLLKKRFILELEEIYSDVIGNQRLRNKEISEVKKADAYILPSVPLAEKIANNKNYVLYHGTCRREATIGKGFNDGKIHVVYAGTFDPRVIGEMSFIKAAKYLDANYCIHVLGFGLRQEDVDNVIKEINNAEDYDCKVTFEGMLYGSEYLEFIQNCHIGIFARDPLSADINSSFPSKIMSYLSNGLRVVSTKADSIARSDVSELLYFCETNSPEDVAKTILSVDFSKPFDGRKELGKIEIKLKNNLKVLLSDFERSM